MQATRPADITKEQSGPAFRAGRG